MAISITRYVDIVSGVGAGASVAQRALVGRIFTDNPKVPVDALIEFDSASDALAYFGGSSEEYARAAFYFGFISKSISAPEKLGFARYPKTAQAARIYGAAMATPLATFTAITSGTMTLSVGGQNAVLTGVNLGAAASYTDVATALQTAIRAAGGTQFTSATVVYDAGTGTFNFTASGTGATAISVTTPGTLAAPLGWTSSNAVFSPGVVATPAVTALASLTSTNNDFGSFCFMTGALTDDDILAVSTWNATNNVSFMFNARVTSANAAAVAASVIANPGTALTLAPLTTQYPEMVPMMILAATDYTRRASVQNYMFQIANLTPSVTSDTDANLYDGLRVNYYGATQTAGQPIYFYQRGLLTGGPTAPVDMNVYANEMWLKDAAQTAILTLMLSLPRIPANIEGRAQVLAILQDCIDRALFNGVISVGKTLTVAQRLFVSQMSGDPLAWHQVQSAGWWLDVVIEPYAGPGGTTEYRAVYTLIYAKDDTIRRVDGTHILI